MSSKSKNKLHGNNAKASQNTDITGLYVTNTVTMSDKKENGVPIVAESNVEAAKEFVDENHK